jgi:hypothetical protein
MWCGAPSVHKQTGVDTMNIYLLKRHAQTPTHDVADGFVVRAQTASEARMLASQQAGDEGARIWAASPIFSTLSGLGSSCVKIGECSDIEPAVVLLRDFNPG